MPKTTRLCLTDKDHHMGRFFLPSYTLKRLLNKHITAPIDGLGLGNKTTLLVLRKDRCLG